MSWIVYDFTDGNGASVIGEWIRAEGLGKADVGAFKQKVFLLRQHGPDLPSGILAGPIYRNIHKFRVNTVERALRPMVCRGPINNDGEFTFLLGAVEVNSKLQPGDAPQQADTNRTVLMEHTERRRVR